MDSYKIALTLSRVLTSGVIMSIEKNDKELPGLERTLKRFSGFSFCCLVNSYSAALHSALWGKQISYGDTCHIQALSDRELKLLKWLGIHNDEKNTEYSHIERFHLNGDGFDFEEIKNVDPSAVVVLNFTEMNYGPAAAILTNDEDIYIRMEQLKIFGATDLRTMWTQEETAYKSKPAVQFNYRLSPLVAACIKLNCMEVY